MTPIKEEKIEQT